MFAGIFHEEAGGLDLNSFGVGGNAVARLNMEFRELILINSRKRTDRSGG